MQIEDISRAWKSKVGLGGRLSLFSLLLVKEAVVRHRLVFGCQLRALSCEF